MKLKTKRKKQSRQAQVLPTISALRTSQLEASGFTLQPSGVWLHLDGRGIGNGVVMALAPEAFEKYLKPTILIGENQDVTEHSIN